MFGCGRMKREVAALRRRTEEIERANRRGEYERNRLEYPLCDKYDLIKNPAWECEETWPSLDINETEKVLAKLEKLASSAESDKACE